jgi:hypothetical protein
MVKTNVTKECIAMTKFDALFLVKSSSSFVESGVIIALTVIWTHNPKSWKSLQEEFSTTKNKVKEMRKKQKEIADEMRRERQKT